MLRRTIQETIRDLTKGWEEKEQKALLKEGLPTQLQKLVDKDLIAPALKEWTDQARVGGKMAAHGTGGGEWGDPKKEWGDQADAQEVKEFCLSFLEYAYVKPARLKKRRGPASKSGKGSNAPYPFASLEP